MPARYSKGLISSICATLSINQSHFVPFECIGSIIVRLTFARPAVAGINS